MGELSSIFAAATSFGGLAVLGVGYWLAGPRQLKPDNTNAKVITARKFPNITKVQKFAVKDSSALYLKFGASKPTEVPLQIFPIEVERTGKSALLVNDKMKIEVEATFHVSVNGDGESAEVAEGETPVVVSPEEAIIKAVESLGVVDHKSVSAIVESRFDNALRVAAAGLTVEQMHGDRAGFLKAVKMAMKLDDCGLKLNEVAVRTLTPASIEAYDPNNAFDAEGLKIVTQIVKTSEKTRNEISALAETQIKETNKVQKLAQLKIEREQSEAQLKKDEDVSRLTAEQEKRVKEITAEQGQLAEIARLSALQTTESARIAQEQQVAIAEEAKKKALAIAAAEREQAAEAARIAKETKVETANRDKQIALHSKSADEAAAQEVANAARAKAVAAEQEVVTVQAVAEAERQKRLDIIRAEAEANKTASTERIASETKVVVAQNEAKAAKTEAEGKAESARIEAEGDAAAVKLAADAQYEHTFKAAKAVADGKLADASAVRALNEAHNVMSQNVRDYQLASQRIAVSPQLVEAMTASIAKIGSFSVVSMDGVGYLGAGGSATGSTPGTGGNVIDQAYDKLLRHSFDKTVIAKVVGALGGDAKIADALPSIASVLNDAAAATAPAAVIPAPEQVAAPEQNNGPETRTPRAPRPAAPGEAA